MAARRWVVDEAQRRLIALFSGGAMRRAASSFTLRGFPATFVVNLANPAKVKGTGHGWVGSGDDDAGSGCNEGVGPWDSKCIGTIVHQGRDVVRSCAVDGRAMDHIEVGDVAAAACRKASVAAGPASEHPYA